MKKTLLSMAAIMVLASGVANANSVEVGEALPSVTISDGGIAVLTGGEVTFKEWSSDSMKNGVIVAKAAREEAAAMMPVSLEEKLKAFNTYTVVNADDAPFGAGMFIEGAISDGKIADPKSNAILDGDGDLFGAWDLEESGTAVIIVKEGKVAYVHEGNIDSAEATKILGLVE